MKIKPKKTAVVKTRRIVLAAAALILVAAVLVHRPQHGVVDDGSGPADIPVTEAPETGVVQEGELDWEYPPGWVDYSDLPAKEDLGDEDQPGLTNWRYLLVNGLDQSNYLRDSYYPDMEEIENGYYFQKRAAADLRAFLQAARAEGYTVSISRTYLSYPDQRVRFNGMASTIFDRGGCTLAEAEIQVKENGYYPGADEHQTGLAVNFVAEGGEAKFSTPVLAWMREHCGEYGFILRYPEGKEDITGRAAEPGHFRYVGSLAAEYIMRKGITLEEFLGAYEEDEEVVWEW